MFVRKGQERDWYFGITNIQMALKVRQWRLIEKKIRPRTGSWAIPTFRMRSKQLRKLRRSQRWTRRVWDRSVWHKATRPRIHTGTTSPRELEIVQPHTVRDVNGYRPPKCKDGGQNHQQIHSLNLVPKIQLRFLADCSYCVATYILNQQTSMSGFYLLP